MPLINYCSRCQKETPNQEKCPYCDKKLTKTGLRYLFLVTIKQVADWYCWKSCLAILIPLLLFFMLIILIGETITGGIVATKQLINDGFFILALLIFSALLLTVWLILDLRGQIQERCVVSEQGISKMIFITNPTPGKLALWLHTKGSVKRLSEMAGYGITDEHTLVRNLFIPWDKISRIQLNESILGFVVYYPKYWAYMTIRCDPSDWESILNYLQKKAKKYQFSIQK